ncbi:MAG: hypothetical protein MET45_29945 [Nostoc sp. LLA-1]|nr:hypothetical protein [Cyanocohniella sp. LLY]
MRDASLYTPDTALFNISLGKNCTFCQLLLLDWRSSKHQEVEDLQEHEIQPLPTQELRKLITTEIEAYQRKIAVLTKQLPEM